jgi:DNA-binding response OmpR family regulator
MDKKKILVADDDSGILEAITLILEDEGYDITPISDGNRITDLCEQVHPDLLLLDIWLGGCNGKDICRSLKSTQATRDVPIIIFSANRDTAIIAREAGANDFIEKPFDMYDLIIKVEQYI